MWLLCFFYPYVFSSYCQILSLFLVLLAACFSLVFMYILLLPGGLLCPLYLFFFFFGINCTCPQTSTKFYFCSQTCKLDIRQPKLLKVFHFTPFPHLDIYYQRRIIVYGGWIRMSMHHASIGHRSNLMCSFVPPSQLQPCLRLEIERDRDGWRGHAIGVGNKFPLRPGVESCTSKSLVSNVHPKSSRTTVETMKP